MCTTYAVITFGITFFIGPAWFFRIAIGVPNLSYSDIAITVIPPWLMLFLFWFLMISFY